MARASWVAGGALVIACVCFFGLREPQFPEVRSFPGQPSVVSEVALSADGSRALSTSAGYMGPGGPDGAIRVWDTGAPEPRHVLDRAHDGRAFAISADGKRAVSVGPNDLRHWDLDAGKSLRAIPVPSPWAVALSPDGKRALTGGWDWTVRLFDLESGAELKAFRTHASHVLSVAFSPDGTRAASGTWGTAQFKLEDRDLPGADVQVWELATGQEVARLKGHRGNVTQLVFAPDGQRLLSATGYHDFSARLWDIAAAREIARVEPGWSFCAVGFTLDGKRALALDQYFEPGLWDVATGALLGRAGRRHAQHVESGAFAAGMRHALTGDRASTMRLWALPSRY